ncbi:hypothetical protein [Thermoleptolyngbya sp.]
MSLPELLPVVSQLSHQDKLRLIHFLLLAVAKEEGYELETTEPEAQETTEPQAQETTEPEAQENLLLKQLEATEAVVWSPHDADGAAQTLSALLVTARQQDNA